MLGLPCGVSVGEVKPERVGVTGPPKGSSSGREFGCGGGSDILKSGLFVDDFDGVEGEAVAMLLPRAGSPQKIDGQRFQALEYAIGKVADCIV